MKKLLIAVVVLGVIAAGIYFGVPRLGITMAQTNAAPTPTPIAAPIQAADEIIAEGRVVPAEDTSLSFATNGIVQEVPVREGDQVTEGDLLARLNAAQLATSIDEAKAAQAIAEARLAQAKLGPSAEDIAAAEAAVEVARSGRQSAEAAVASARANLARSKTGPTAEDIAIAEHRIEVAKNARWAAQAQRDAICGRVGKGAAEVDCDAAKAAVNRSEEEVTIAELQLKQAKTGPKREDIAAAQAQVEQALGQLTTIDAQVRKAEADLARSKTGPTAEDIAVAEAQVEQARATVKKAEAALADTELHAPIAGTVISLNAKVGQFVGPSQPAVRLADLGAWRIETTDLSELNVVNLQVGDPVTITLDALPDLEIPGKVTRIEELGEMQRGEIVYKVIVAPNEHRPELRWNMTANVTIARNK